jgi:short-subunit dehydrogenase
MRKVAIVTGASSGIGEALAVAMGAQGTHVVLVARSVDRLTALAARIEGAGGKATVLPADLAAPEPPSDCSTRSSSATCRWTPS